MTGTRPTRRRLVFAAAGGVLAVGALAGLAGYVGTGFLADAPQARPSAPETATSATAGQVQEGVPMAVHPAPRPVADVRFETAEGQSATLADLRGKAVLLNVWATWCAPCRDEMPTLDRLQARLGGEDFEVVALSIDRAGIGAVSGFYDEIGVQHLAKYVDDSGKAVRELDAAGLPTTLLLDRQGREVARHVGPAAWDTPEMMTFIREQGDIPVLTERRPE